MRSIFSVSEVFKDEFVLCVHAKSLSHGQLFATPRTVAHQAPVSVGFSRQEYWHGLPCPPSGDLPDPGMEPGSPALREDSLPLVLLGEPSVRACFFRLLNEMLSSLFPSLSKYSSG